MSYPGSLLTVANALQVDPWLLNSVISYESEGDPQAVSPDKQAFGLIQFRGQSIKDLGYRSGYDLISALPTYDSQMLKAVYPYLKKYYPFDSSQSFLLSVFYPAYRHVPEFWVFPKEIRRKNVGISMPLDYINRVYRRSNRIYLPRFLIYGAISLWMYQVMKK